jgi:hypothetical protein
MHRAPSSLALSIPQLRRGHRHGHHPAASLMQTASPLLSYFPNFLCLLNISLSCLSCAETPAVMDSSSSASVLLRPRRVHPFGRPRLARVHAEAWRLSPNLARASSAFRRAPKRIPAIDRRKSGEPPSLLFISLTATPPVSDTFFLSPRSTAVLELGRPGTVLAGPAQNRPADFSSSNHYLF